MTEDEWRDSTHLFGLTAFAHGRADPRRLRAYATSWVEQVRHLLDHQSRACLARHNREAALKSPEALVRSASEVVSWGSGAVRLDPTATPPSTLGRKTRLEPEYWLSRLSACVPIGVERPAD